MKVNSRGTHDIYIDDLVGLGLDLIKSDSLKRSKRAPLLAIDACSRRRAPDEPIPSYDMAARHKLDAEGLLEETKMILGWMWDFRRLTISLPTNKFTAWTEGIIEMMNSKNLMGKTLETTIGRLTHVSMIIPPVHHFLRCLHKLHFRAKNNNRRLTNNPQICIYDLKLMKKFLKWKLHIANQLTFIDWTCAQED
jgi:hypothetical protein